MGHSTNDVIMQWIGRGWGGGINKPGKMLKRIYNTNRLNFSLNVFLWPSVAYEFMTNGKRFWVDFSAFLVSAKSTKCNKYFFGADRENNGLAHLLIPFRFTSTHDSASRANGQGPKPKDRTLNEVGGQHLLVRDPAKEFMCVEGNRKAFFMHASNLWPNKACALGQIATIHHPPHPFQPFPLF